MYIYILFKQILVGIGNFLAANFKADIPKFRGIFFNSNNIFPFFTGIIQYFTPPEPFPIRTPIDFCVTGNLGFIKKII